MEYRWFDIEDFDSADAPGSADIHMDKGFVLLLDQAREIAGIPFVVNSGYRTPEHNANVGGVPGSSHTKGLAADIGYDGKRKTAARMVAAFTMVGIRRIGVYETFIHVDIDESKPLPAYW